MVDRTDGGFDRRSVLKLLGSAGVLGVAGAGFATLSGSVAGATVNITASGPVTVTNDRGDVTRVTVDPAFEVTWDGLDDAVGKVFWLLEARVADGDWHPLYRATPWLYPDQISTTGSLDLSQFSGRLGRQIVVADEDGRPNYSAFDFSGLGSVDRQSYLDGTSMGSADEYTQSGTVDLNGESLQNNFPNENAGYYGAASDTSPFDNPTGDSTASTTVELRYTIELQRPNLNQLEFRIKNSSTYTMPSGYNSMSTEERKEALAGVIDELRPADIDAVNSRLIMEGEDGYPAFDGYDDGAGIPYNVLRDNASEHVGIILENTAFTANVTNEPADSGTTGNTNPGAEDMGQP